MTDDHGNPIDHGTLDVLLVEDNDSDYLLLSRQIRKMLAPRRCERASNRAELQTTLSGEWGLIITDLHLPDVEEEALLDMIEASQPHTPCLILSGSSQEIDRFGVHRNVFRVIEKGQSAALQAALAGPWSR